MTNMFYGKSYKWCSVWRTYLQNARAMELQSFFKNGPTPASFCLFPFFFKHKFYSKNCRLQLHSNSDRRSRRGARWPLDHRLQSYNLRSAYCRWWVDYHLMKYFGGDLEKHGQVSIDFKILLRKLFKGPWWWSSGQRARLLLWWSEFESRWLQQSFL